MSAPQYRPGDVVNGHRLNAEGTAWELVAPAVPPAERKKHGHRLAWWIGGGVFVAVVGLGYMVWMAAFVANPFYEGNSVAECRANVAIAESLAESHPYYGTEPPCQVR